MFVDTALLNCGAEFSRSAGDNVREGAERLGSVQLPAKIFGDFDAADGFHQALGHARDAHAVSMRYHQTALETLADEADHAAVAFTRQDGSGAASIGDAGSHLG